MGGRGGKGSGGGKSAGIVTGLTPSQQTALNTLGGPNSVFGKQFLANIATYNRNNPSAATGTYGLGGGGSSKSGFVKGSASANTGGIQGGGSSNGGGGGSSTTINQQPLPPGYKPTFDTSTVPLKPGTNHTPEIRQSSMAAKLPQSIFSDPSAPVGSAENPHVFDNSMDSEWRTFGAMHTNQDKAAWDSAAAWKHARDYTEGTFEYNRNSAPAPGSPIGTPGKDNKYTEGLDEAFRDSAVKPFEEHVILASSQNIMFFAGANGLNIPDVSNPGQTKAFNASTSMDADDILNDLNGLVGQDMIYTNFMSTAIPVDKVFNSYSNNIRVLVKMKPGQKGVYVSGNPKMVAGNMTNAENTISIFKGTSNEKEIVLPRNQMLRILEVVPTTQPMLGGYEVDVIIEIVDQPNV